MFCLTDRLALLLCHFLSLTTHIWRQISRHGLSNILQHNCTLFCNEWFKSIIYEPNMGCRDSKYKMVRQYVLEYFEVKSTELKCDRNSIIEKKMEIKWVNYLGILAHAPSNFHHWYVPVTKIYLMHNHTYPFTIKNIH